MNKININICKVKTIKSGPVIWLNADCPDGYTFDKCTVRVEEFNKKRWTTADRYLDFSPSLLAHNCNNFNQLLPVAIEGVGPHVIYTVELRATSTDKSKNSIQALAYVSDVQFVYECLLSEIMSLSDDCCAQVSDEAIRMYLILYGHTVAMESQQLDLAKELYQMLFQCGQCKTSYHNNCNCK